MHTSIKTGWVLTGEVLFWGEHRAPERHNLRRKRPWLAVFFLRQTHEFRFERSAPGVSSAHPPLAHPTHADAGSLRRASALRNYLTNSSWRSWTRTTVASATPTTAAACSVCRGRAPPPPPPAPPRDRRHRRRRRRSKGATYLPPERAQGKSFLRSGGGRQVSTRDTSPTSGRRRRSTTTTAIAAIRAPFPRLRPAGAGATVGVQRGLGLLLPLLLLLPERAGVRAGTRAERCRAWTPWTWGMSSTYARRSRRPNK